MRYMTARRLCPNRKSTSSGPAKLCPNGHSTGWVASAPAPEAPRHIAEPRAVPHLKVCCILASGSVWANWISLMKSLMPCWASAGEGFGREVLFIHAISI
jgi:hypothetical protein